MKEILGMPEGIPQDLLNKAVCVVVYPSVKKAAFIVGGSYGRGVITCRKGKDFDGPWSAPAMLAIESGSFGFQIGGQATDFVLLITDRNDTCANRNREEPFTPARCGIHAPHGCIDTIAPNFHAPLRYRFVAGGLNYTYGPKSINIQRWNVRCRGEMETAEYDRHSAHHMMPFNES